MTVYLHIYIKTKKSLNLEKALELFKHLLKNGCKIDESFGYWDDSKGKWISSNSSTALSKYADKLTNTLSLKYDDLEFHLSINENSIILLSIDSYFLRKNEKSARKGLESIKKSVAEIIEVESINEVYE